MIVYNVTIKVDNSILQDWLIWIEEHRAEVVNTGCFTASSFYELLEPKVDEHRTFVVQYFANSMDDYNRYISDFATKMRNESSKKFSDNVAIFRSLLEKIA